MGTNDTNNTNKPSVLIFPHLSYTIAGICFRTHNELGRYAKEKQYADRIEQLLKEIKMPYKREFCIGSSGNIVDFLIDDKIVLELKAKRIVMREDYYQLQRYLQESQIKLGLLVNFRNRFIKPMRIVRIDTEKSTKYAS